MKPADASSASFLETLRSERRDLLNRLRQTRFSTLKPGFSQSQIVPFATYSPWLDDAAFAAVYERIRDATLVDVYRCYELHALAVQMRRVPGDMVEVGVWRGGTAALLASAAPEKTLHLFDTFAGVAKADHDRDTLYAGGEHADTDPGVVTRLFAGLGLAATIRVGLFPDDTARFLPERIALAHIDVDTYGSARESFAAIWPRVPPNGIVVFDDYGFFGCEGVTQAVNEIRTEVAEALFVYNANGHGLVIKPAAGGTRG